MRIMLGLALAFGCVSRGGSSIDEPAPQSLEELRVRVQRELEEASLPGVGIAIVQGGEVSYAGGVGQADLARVLVENALALQDPA